MKKFFQLSLLTLLAMLSTVSARAAEWCDFEIDLMNPSIFTSDEEVQWQQLPDFGIAVDADGKTSRVSASDASAVAVFTAFKWHSNDHGLAPGTITIAVPGNTKISVGGCNWGSDLTVKTAEGASFTIANAAKCYNPSDASTVSSGTYVGGATTLTITGGSYVRYYKFEKAEAAEYNYSFSLGEAEGVAPAAGKVIDGESFTIPANYTMYVEGKTLTGWSDGAKTYAIGEKVTPTADLTLSPVFETNTVSLKDPRDNEVTVKWNFRRDQGAPTVGWEKNGVHPWVAQATVGGKVIDVKMDVDVSAGKFNNGNNSDWIQINNGTKLIIPAAKTVALSLEAYNDVTNTTVNGESISKGGSKTPLYDYAGDAESLEIAIADGSYFRYVQAVYPAIKEQSGGKTYTNEAASAVWAFNSATDYEGNTKSPEDGFATLGVDVSAASAISTEAAKLMDGKSDGITFLKLQPTNGANDLVKWTLKPTKGLTFTPTKVSMHIARFGTDAQNGVTISAVLEDGTTEQLGNYTAARNTKDASGDKYSSNSNWTSFVEITLTDAQKQKLATSGIFTITATIGVGNAKQGGFADVHIDGLLNGTISEVAKYTLTTNVVPAGAGTVTAKPKSAEYEDGTEVTLTAEKNFGYKFVNWTDAAGAVLGSDPAYSFTINSNSVVNANFEAVNTYELVTKVEGGANDYMLSLLPAPTVVDGKNMYEEGTKVAMAAASNPVLEFTNWDNGETASEMTITMTENKTFTATYSAVDFVAGWDFYMPGGRSRAADFYGNVDNQATTMVMIDANGTDKGFYLRPYNNSYEGKTCALNWNALAEKYYFQTKFNATEFKNIKVQSLMMYNYNAYSVQKLEASLDGENWETIVSQDLGGAKNWQSVSGTLPATYNNQPAVFLRWIPDYTSEIKGTSSANDGTTLANVYITGDKELIDDGVPPVLVSSVPAEGATNASANGKIVLTFDEKVKLTASAKATLGNAVLTNGQATGKTVTYEYKSLPYSTAFTFTIAAGSVADLTDNAITKDIVINFQTKVKPTVTKQLYDFVVGTDGTLDEALVAANNRGTNATDRFRIFIPNGKYVFDTKGTTIGGDGNTYPDPRSYLNSPYVSFIGESMEGVEITNVTPPATWDNGFGPACPLEGIGKGDVLIINSGGHDAYFQNLTLKSSMGDSHGRDIVVNDQSNRTIFKDARLWGYQDTYVSNSDKGKFYFEGGVIRGRTDYLCGKGDVVFNEVTLQQCGGGGYIAVPSKPKNYGYVFWDCTITKETSDVNFYLGRPWGSGTPIACFINTKMEAAPLGNGWADMSGGWPKRFAEYNSTLTSGATIDLSGRRTSWDGSDGNKHANDPILTLEETNAMSIANVMGQDDDWDPVSLTEQASAPANVYLNTTTSVMTWSDSNYALLWAVCKDGNVVDFTVSPTYTVDDATATWSVRAANEMGGLSEATVATKADKVNTLLEATAYKVTGKVTNLTGKDLTGTYFQKFVDNGGNYEAASVLAGDATLLTVSKNSEGILNGFDIVGDAIAYSPEMYFTVDGRNFSITNLAGDATGSLQLTATSNPEEVALESVAVIYKGIRVGTIDNIIFKKDATAVKGIEAEQNTIKDGKYLIKGKVVIVKEGNTYEASGAMLQ